jgi:hypothetical protein
MARRSKYGNVRTVVDGILFHSRKEAARYAVLRDLQADGKLSDLRLQVSHQITINGIKVCRYISDFEYTLEGRHIIEDVKGRLTDVYKLKKKLMSACLGLDILET